ncbi:hypothetical protein BH23PSE1_BH23PSE1_00040 [soil metagenome]
MLAGREAQLLMSGFSCRTVGSIPPRLSLSPSSRSSPSGSAAACSDGRRPRPASRPRHGFPQWRRAGARRRRSPASSCSTARSSQPRSPRCAPACRAPSRRSCRRVHASRRARLSAGSPPTTGRRGWRGPRPRWRLPSATMGRRGSSPNATSRRRRRCRRCSRSSRRHGPNSGPSSSSSPTRNCPRRPMASSTGCPSMSAPSSARAARWPRSSTTIRSSRWCRSSRAVSAPSAPGCRPLSGSSAAARSRAPSASSRPSRAPRRAPSAWRWRSGQAGGLSRRKIQS